MGFSTLNITLSQTSYAMNLAQRFNTPSSSPSGNSCVPSSHTYMLLLYQHIEKLQHDKADDHGRQINLDASQLGQDPG